MEQKLINQTDSQGRKQGYWEEQDKWGHTSKGHYVDDLKEGVWEVYHSNGTSTRRNYHHGELHGLRESYYPNGTLMSRGHYLHGNKIREDSPETLKIWNKILSQIGQPAWLKISPENLLFLGYLDLF